MNKDMITSFFKRFSRVGAAILSIFTLLTSIGLVWAYTNTSALSGSVTVNHYCAFAANVAGVNFGGVAGMNPGTNTGTMSNTIGVTDTGNLASNILTDGSGSWTYNANTFGVQNTVYSSSISTSYGAGTVLTTSSTDTFIPVNTASANAISYGMAIPAGQAPGTYTLTINLISSC